MRHSRSSCLDRTTARVVIAEGTFAAASSLATSIVSSTDGSSLKSFDVGVSQIDRSHSTRAVLSSCQTHPISAMGVLHIQLTAGRLHHLASSHEASMWTHHHSRSTFLQLANRHQRPGHFRNLAGDSHRSTSPISYTTVFCSVCFSLSTGRDSDCCVRTSSSGTLGSQAHIRADRLKPQLHCPQSPARSIPPLPRGHQGLDVTEAPQRPRASIQALVPLLSHPSCPCLSRFSCSLACGGLCGGDSNRSSVREGSPRNPLCPSPFS